MQFSGSFGNVFLEGGRFLQRVDIDIIYNLYAWYNSNEKWEANNIKQNSTYREDELRWTQLVSHFMVAILDFSHCQKSKTG